MALRGALTRLRGALTKARWTAQSPPIACPWPRHGRVKGGEILFPYPVRHCSVNTLTPQTVEISMQQTEPPHPTHRMCKGQGNDRSETGSGPERRREFLPILRFYATCFTLLPRFTRILSRICTRFYRFRAKKPAHSSHSLLYRTSTLCRGPRSYGGKRKRKEGENTHIRYILTDDTKT